MKLWARRSPSPVPLEQHVRSAVWVAALLAILGTVAALPANHLAPGAVVLATTGLAWLAWHWGRSRRAVRAHWSGDVADAAAVALVVAAMPSSMQVLSLPIAGVFLRTLTPGLRRAATRAVLHLAAVGAATGAALPSPSVTGALTTAATTVVAVLPGLAFITGLAALLGAALGRVSRAAERDRLLAEGGTRLLAATTAADVVREADEIARAMVADLTSVQARVLDHGAASPAVGTAIARAGTGAGTGLDHDPGAPSTAWRVGPSGYDACGRVEVRGPVRAVAEVRGPLAVLAQQVESAMRTCEVLAELRLRAETDALTGLATRAVLRDALIGATLSAAREEADDPDAQRATVLVVDCDHFKAINDTFGHLAGDAVLVEVARRLRVATRPGDLVARLGGDEFAVLLRPAARPGADAAVRRLVSVLRGAVLLPDQSIDFSCSVGSVEVRPGRSPEALLHGADTAMYRAKTSGAGHVSLDRVGQDAREGAGLPA